MLKIRIPSNAWSEQKIVLDNVTLNLILYWNERGSSGNWYVSLYDEDNDPIVTGIKLSINYAVFLRYLDARLPEGNLYCIKLNPRATEITRDNLGTDFILVYLTSQEELDVLSI